jgi:hypothetical protein
MAKIVSAEMNNSLGMSIFFIHKGNPFYLKYVLSQAAHSQCNDRVILIGDQSNRALGLCEWHDLDDFSDRARAFLRIYQHLSPNDFNFELFCIQRWLYLSEFVSKQQINGSIFYLDSDVLVYEGLSERFMNQDCDLALTREIGPAFTFFRSPEVLYRFADFIESSYRPGDTLEILKRIYSTGDSPFWMQTRYVSDMQLLGLYARTLGKVVDLEIPWNGWVFDYGFGDDAGYRYNTYKRIKWLGRDERGYYGIRKGERQYFAGLHFQVGAKVFIPQYYTGVKKFSDRYYYAYIKWRGRVTTMIKWILTKLRLFYP